MGSLEKFEDVKLVEKEEQVIVGGIMINSPIELTKEEERFNLYWDFGILVP